MIILNLIFRAAVQHLVVRGVDKAITLIVKWYRDEKV